MTTQRRRPLTLLAVAMSATIMPLSTAHAGDGDVERRGSCSGSTSGKLKAGPEDGRIEVEGEVDSNVDGQVWKWRLRHNGDRVARGKRTTQPPSGSFEVRRVLVNAGGTDTLVFRARNPRTDEVCRGVLRY